MGEQSTYVSCPSMCIRAGSRKAKVLPVPVYDEHREMYVWCFLLAGLFGSRTFPFRMTYYIIHDVIHIN